jgi:hypothetical protein
VFRETPTSFVNFAVHLKPVVDDRRRVVSRLCASPRGASRDDGPGPREFDD